MKEKYKKKLKKPIDIEKESAGSPVAPIGKKEKKLDLTDEIKKFLTEPITLESIKRILLRLKGPVSEQDVMKSKINIYGFPTNRHGKRYVYDFLIMIETKNWTTKYFIGPMMFAYLNFFDSEKVDNSILKQNLCHALRNWLHNNLDKVRVIEDKI